MTTLEHTHYRRTLHMYMYYVHILYTYVMCISYKIYCLYIYILLCVYLIRYIHKIYTLHMYIRYGHNNIRYTHFRSTLHVIHITQIIDWRFAINDLCNVHCIYTINCGKCTHVMCIGVHTRNLRLPFTKTH